MSGSTTATARAFEGLRWRVASAAGDMSGEEKSEDMRWCSCRAVADSCRVARHYNPV